jgi:hypothetical protein
MNRTEFDAWCKKRQLLTDRSRLKYLQWQERAQWLRDRGEGCSELDEAVVQLGKALDVEYWFLPRVRYDEEFREVHHNDETMVMQYRKNTTEDLGKVKRIAASLTNLTTLG